MTSSNPSPDCPVCGGAPVTPACPQCGRPAASGAVRLQVIPGGGGSGRAAEVRLRREYKGATVDGLLTASDEALDLLPGRVQSMNDAVEAGDLAGADRAMNRALGLLLAGPGHRPSRRQHARWLVWVWFAALVAALWWVTR